MSNQGKFITRREVYDLVWRRPISELAEVWGTTAAGVVEVCGKLNIPLPGPGHWELVQAGQQVERALLPAPERNTPIGVSTNEPRKEETPERAPAVEKGSAQPGRKVEVPKDFANAHPLVTQTRKALTTDTCLRKGILETRSRLGRSLAVLVSPAQLDRALLICDAVLKGIVELGGRVKPDRRSGTRLFVGKQAVTFQIRETTTRYFLDLDMTDEERRKQGYGPSDKYGWRGSGRLQFSMFVGDLYDRRWRDSKRLSLEDQVGEIIDEFARSEEEAKRVRLAREERDKRWAEEQAQREEERRRIRAAEEAQEREVAREEENRARLVQKAGEWRDARVLRGFIRACQRKVEAGPELQGGGNWGKQWLAWASAHADRLDPMKNGFLDAERQRLVGAG